MPSAVVEKVRSDLNDMHNRKNVRDKSEFRRRLEQADIAVVRELLVIRDGQFFSHNGETICREDAERILVDHDGDYFIKPVDGALGARSFAAGDLGFLDQLEASTNWLIQPRVAQHSTLAKYHPNSLNTIRIHSIFEDGVCQLDMGMARFGVGGNDLDNGSAGGIKAGLDLTTGRLLSKPTHKFELTYSIEHYDRHPDSNMDFSSLAVPFIEDACQIVRRAAALFPSQRLLAWDVAITPDGPVVIEANDGFVVSDLHRHHSLPDSIIGDYVRRHYPDLDRYDRL